MQITRAGKTLVVPGPAGPESYLFASVAEAKGRAAFIAEALSWIGTPFVDCADVKGRNGAVDCAMLLTRCAVDTGLVPAFDPRPYAPQWHVHHDEELFLQFLTDRLGAREITDPRPGDIAVFKFHRTYAHGTVILNSAEMVHAWSGYKMVMRTGRTEGHFVHTLGTPRPVRYFDLWSVTAAASYRALRSQETT